MAYAKGIQERRHHFMNIKEAERLTGISRRNIRFYEQKGMLRPARNPENDYREYTPEDIQNLKYIRALRMVDMPLEEIQKVLAGKLSLEQAAGAQEAQLRRKIQDAQTAIRFCQAMSKGETDIDSLLAQMDQPENRGQLFSRWLRDYQAMSKAMSRSTFTFTPDTPITNPREFTDALLIFARENHLDLTITREGMYPEFTLDGVEYSAERLYTHVSRIPTAIVRCTVKHPELLEPDMPRGKKSILKILHNFWLLLAGLAFFAIVILPGRTAFFSTTEGMVSLLVLLILAGIGLYRFRLFFFNNKDQ